MANPFGALEPALQVLASKGTVLPATGQAVLDLVSPDLEEAYDRATGGRDERVTAVWETRRNLYHSLRPVSRRERHFFRYFLDGSAQTFFVGTLLEHERSSPVQLAQVGAAAVGRGNGGDLRSAGIRYKVLLLLDKQALSDQLWCELETILDSTAGFELRSTSRQEDRFSKALGITEPRSRGAHRANWAMRELEVELAREGIRRSGDEWLVVDGGLGNEYLDWEGPPLIGVAKSFRRDTQFVLGTGPRARHLNLYQLLAGLATNHRTAVFPRWPGESREGKMIFWYVRIRPQKWLDYPLMGVVKVELPNPEGERIDSDLADLISCCLLAERNVTPYGQDSRWHAHLYPISVAERVIRDRFYSPEVLKAAIRWPQIHRQR